MSIRVIEQLNEVVSDSSWQRCLEGHCETSTGEATLPQFREPLAG
jgi:hypothetical protein